MTEIEQLRNSIDLLDRWLSGDLETTVNIFALENANDASKTLLKLYEDHPGIQGVIDGTHWIAPNEPVYKDILKGSSIFAEHFQCNEGSENYKAACKFWEAMRKASGK